MRGVSYLYILFYLVGFTVQFPATAIASGHTSLYQVVKKDKSPFVVKVGNTVQYNKKSISPKGQRKMKGMDRHATGLPGNRWSVSVPLSEPDNTVRESLVCTVSFLYNKRGPPALS